MPQTALQRRLDASPHLVASLQFLAAAFLVPAALWLVSTLYSERQDRARAVEARYAQVTAAVPELRASRASLDDTCVGSDASVCAASVNAALVSFHEARSRTRDVVARHLPRLTPTMLLFSVLDVGSDVALVWGNYIECLEGGGVALDCDWQRRAYVTKNLEVASYLIDYMECEVHATTAEERDLVAPPHCEAVLAARRPWALERPEVALQGYGGGRLPAALAVVVDEIWCQELVPGSGLEAEECLPVSG